MPLPEKLARFNRVATNRVMRHVAGRLPGFAIVTHTGRRTGQAHRNPVPSPVRPMLRALRVGEFMVLRRG